MSTVTIPKKEYERLKALDQEAQIDEQIEQSIDDLKNRRITWS